MAAASPEAVELDDTEWKTELHATIDITDWKQSDKNSSSLYRIVLSVGPAHANVPLYMSMIETVSPPHARTG